MSVKREIRMIKNMAESIIQMNEKLADLARHSPRKSEFKDVISEIEDDKELVKTLIAERKKK